jgi:hypothetical protein
MVWPAWANDPGSCAGGSVATGRASHVGQVEGDDPDSKGYPGPPGWGLGVRLTTPPRKKHYCHEISKKKEEV